MNFLRSLLHWKSCSLICWISCLNLTICGGIFVNLFKSYMFYWFFPQVFNHLFWLFKPLAIRLDLPITLILMVFPEVFWNCFHSVQLLSRVQLFVTSWITARQASLSITNSQSPLKPMPIKPVMPSSHLILCCVLLLLPPTPPSIRVFSSESLLRIRWRKYWSFIFSISPSNEYSGLISSRMDWLDLLAVQGTLGSLLQHHSSKASIFRHSAFFTVQLSHPYMTTGKTITLKSNVSAMKML